MAKPEHPKPPPDGVRGAFILIFAVLAFGIFLLCWLMIRNTELGNRLLGVRVDKIEPATEKPKNASTKDDTENAVNASGVTEISGRVSFVGMPPAEKVIVPLLTHGDCAGFYNDPVKTRFFRVGSDGGFADVYVYVKKGLEGKSHPQLTNAVSIDCVKCLFQPYVFALQTSQPLKIHNRDQCWHGILSERLKREEDFAGEIIESQEQRRRQGAAGNVTFSAMAPGKSYECRFSAPELFRKLRCTVHVWEFTYACISDHPYFAITDADGRFKFPFGLPAGRYTLAAVHRKLGEITQEVEVKGPNQWIDFSFAPSKELLAKLGGEPEKDSEEKNIQFGADSTPNPVSTYVKRSTFEERNRSNLTGAPTSIVNNRAVRNTPSMGLIHGRVFLNGKPPPGPKIDAIMNDPQCGKLHAAAPEMPFYVVDAERQLADVWVYLERASSAPQLLEEFPVPPDHVVIDQVACEFKPYVVGIQTGQTLEVRNSDPMMHNVHFIPAIPGNKESNKAQMPKSMPLLYRFDRAEGFLRLKCDVHSWMFAYVCVTDHPFFAITSKDGSFTIPNVPPGKHTLVAMHRKAGTVKREIVVVPISEGVPGETNFEIEVKP